MGNNHSRKKKRYEVRASDAVTDDANPPAPISQPDSSPPSEKRTEKLKKDKVSKKNSKKFWKVADPPEKKPGEDEEKCSVCLFELKASGDEEQMPVVQLTKCSHYFHKDCVKHCVDKEHLKCPVIFIIFLVFIFLDMRHTLWNYDWESTIWIYECINKLISTFTWIRKIWNNYCKCISPYTIFHHSTSIILVTAHKALNTIILGNTTKGQVAQVTSLIALKGRLL